MRDKASVFNRDQRGAAAIEFAFVVPILLCMYLMTMEISQGIEANKKLGRAGTLVGDLVTQQDAITSSEVDGILQIGDSLLQPYNRSMPVITVTAINVQRNTETRALTGRVSWSRRMTDGKFAPVSAIEVDVPEFLRVEGTFVIRVDAALNYKPVLLHAAEGSALGIGAAFDHLSMGETYYMRPRRSTTIPCIGC
ncbi:TadE/TadG family type IV pilus assembly protein [Tianweitania sp.]|uniref:TadE/TadG family type IV pilus assembly protein n=1 Tax=Tianweitania sp. TaxID=2021634 RepID=UPI00289A16A8|nr:TadE/TadG family type IV pilus assembly protein [Tianweitania sp.]